MKALIWSKSSLSKLFEKISPSIKTSVLGDIMTVEFNGEISKVLLGNKTTIIRTIEKIVPTAQIFTKQDVIEVLLS